MGKNGSVEELLLPHRERIVRGWCERIAASYPERTAAFLHDQKDPFANPVGAALREGVEAIFGAFLADRGYEELAPALDRIVRIRAVQEFTPAAAVGFVFELKGLLREALEGDLSQPWVREGLGELEVRVDRLVLSAFNVFMECREQVYSARVKQIRNLSLDRMERLNAWREQRVKPAGSGDSGSI
ncbi:RsbRD N-terminal domain-containing protein [Planctomycetota bacterium]